MLLLEVCAHKAHVPPHGTKQEIFIAAEDLLMSMSSLASILTEILFKTATNASRNR